MHRLILFVCVFFSSHLFSLEDETDFQRRYENLEIVKYARLFHDKIAGAESDIQNEFNKIWQTLSPYSSDPTIESAVRRFVEDQLEGVVDSFEIWPLANTTLSGHSSDPVFFILDEHGELRLVVKAFQHPFTDQRMYLKEISTLDFMIKNRGKFDIAVPYPLAAGKTIYEDIPYGLLAQSPAPGVRLDVFIERIKNSSGVERQARLQRFEKAVAEASKAFGRLISGPVHVVRKINEATVVRIKERFIKLANSPAAPLIENEGIEIAAIENLMDVLFAKANSTVFIAGYSHPSAHTANVFFDEESGQVAYIDVAKMHPSFDGEGNPLSFSAHDLVRCSESIRKLSTGVLTKSELEHLIQTMEAAYKEANPDPNLDVLLEVLRFNSILSRLRKHGENSILLQDPQQREFNRQIFVEQMQYLRQMMENNSR